MAKKISSKSILNLCKNWGQQSIERVFVNTLANDGERAMTKAYKSRNWRNRTGNLHDSYVSAVFLNGKLQRHTIRQLPDLDESELLPSHRSEYVNVNRPFEKKDEAFDVNGRDEAMNFLESYQLRNHFEKGVRLVVAAPMWYASILEGKGYQVISEIERQLASLCTTQKKVKIRTASYTGALSDENGDTPQWVLPYSVVRRRNVEFGGNAFKNFRGGKMENR